MTVLLRKLFFPSFVVCAVLAVGLSTPPIATGQAPTEKPSRDQQIADIEKQIKGLQQKLEELKRGGPAPTVPDGVLNPEWVKTFHWRSIGPAAMGGRITALSIFEARSEERRVGKGCT